MATAAATLRAWVVAQLASGRDRACDAEDPLLCYPRILGYVFNPLTVYFCRDGDVLKAILYEVHNTFGERHTYVIPVERRRRHRRAELRQGALRLALRADGCAYHFHIEPPGERVAIGIDETDARRACC